MSERKRYMKKVSRQSGGNGRELVKGRVGQKEGKRKRKIGVREWKEKKEKKG